MTFKTVEQMEAEIEELKEEYHKAFVAGGLKERAKIVAWVRALSPLAQGIAIAIEEGRHLK